MVTWVRELRADLINVRMVYLGEKPNLFQTNIIKHSPRVPKYREKRKSQYKLFPLESNVIDQ